MPKEHKKRGRRDEQKKRKRDHDSERDERDAASKRRRSHVDDADTEGAVPFQDEAIDDVTRPGATPFFGNLEDDEQEYFKRADEMLELNQFDGPDGRDMFLESVWKEADGKELKLANSQSCSRLMERLILLSSPRQLKNLFQKFNEHFVHLVQHRFASHCCEALFIRAAPLVTEEHSKPETMQTPPPSDPSQEPVSMENCFLFALDQFEPYLGFLMTDKFASHVLRVLLIILSGAPLEKESKSAVHSKRKEKVGVSGADNTKDLVLSKRKVPASFLAALEKVIGDISDGLDSAQLRLLATHPTGNPTLQLMLKLELAQFGKSRAKDERSVIHKLLPDDPIVEGTESASFVNGLVYDPIGSRLLETIIENAPGKLFKSLYAEFFRDRMGSLARNEIASYVAAKVLERLGKDDLEEATRQIVEQIPGLVERNRTAIIKTLVERCAVRGVQTAPIRAQLEKAYSGPSGFEITRMLKLGEAPSEDGKSSNKHESSHPDKTHGSLLAQAMMEVPGSLGNLIFDAFVNLSVPVTLRIARDPTASRTLQAALTSSNATVIFRRKVIQQFYGKVGELALDPAGSHVIDAIWEGTHGLAFIRERIAEELSENEAALRESHVGRAVWRNWRMDLYKRRRADWVKQSRYAAGNEGFQSFPESNGAPQLPNQRAAKHMTAIELARRKHAEAKAAQAKKENTSSKKDTKDSYTGSKGGSRKGKEKAHVAAH